MKSCSVPSCHNNTARNPNLAFFGLPKDVYVRDEWLELLNMRRCDIYRHIEVCEIHFRAMDFCTGKKQLKIHAVPALHLGLEKNVLKQTAMELGDSDSDYSPEEIVEVEHASPVKKVVPKVSRVETKVKATPVEKEDDSGRRPSRRAARVAAKKISNTVRKYSYGGGVEEEEEESGKSEVVGSQLTVSRNNPAARQYNKQKVQRKKYTAEDIDLVMECHEELLSAVQAETLLKAQLEYNRVMRTLRTLKANNVRIISEGIELENLDSTSIIPGAKGVPPAFVSAMNKTNIITVTPITLNDGSPVVPMRLSAALKGVPKL